MVTPNQQSVRRNTFANHTEQRLPGRDGTVAPGSAPSSEPGEWRDNRGDDPAQNLARAIAENFRDNDDAQRVQPASYLRELRDVYTEPFYLALPNEPRGGISLIRIRKVGDEETPVQCSGAVHFTWDGTQSRAVIKSIDGLTPNGSSYRFNFLVVG